jgi:hypothetical protein
MCPKFDGFRRIAPEQDFGMDSNEPFLTALQMFNAKKDKQ